MADTRGRRKRRQAKQALRYGAKAKPRHALIGGRTGSKLSAMLKFSRKRMLQRKNKPLQKHANETWRPRRG